MRFVILVLIFVTLCSFSECFQITDSGNQRRLRPYGYNYGYPGYYYRHGLFPNFWVISGILLLILGGLTYHRAYGGHAGLFGRVSDIRSIDENWLREDQTDRIFVALDENWLTELEEKVLARLGKSSGRNSVVCCIEESSSSSAGRKVANCRASKKERKLSTFQCDTGLVYNFEFADKNDNNYKKRQ